jgi:hypothetical protein
MTPRHRRPAALACAVGVACTLLVGCGIQLQDEAQPLPVEALPPVESAPTPSRDARMTTVYFTNGRQLEGVPEAIGARTAEGVLGALAAGPPADRQDELRSLLIDPFSTEPLLTVADVAPSGRVTLVRSDAFLDVPAPDQILLIGQVVMSLDELGMSRVQLVDPSGAPVSISLPDGRTRVGEVTRQDFEELVIEP